MKSSVRHSKMKHYKRWVLSYATIHGTQESHKRHCTETIWTCEKRAHSVTWKWHHTKGFQDRHSLLTRAQGPPARTRVTSGNHKDKGLPERKGVVSKHRSTSWVDGKKLFWHVKLLHQKHTTSSDVRPQMSGEHCYRGWVLPVPCGGGHALHLCKFCYPCHGQDLLDAWHPQNGEDRQRPPFQRWEVRQVCGLHGVSPSKDHTSMASGKRHCREVHENTWKVPPCCPYGEHPLEAASLHIPAWVPCNATQHNNDITRWVAAQTQDTHKDAFSEHTYRTGRGSLQERPQGQSQNEGALGHSPTCYTLPSPTW